MPDLHKPGGDDVPLSHHELHDDIKNVVISTSSICLIECLLFQYLEVPNITWYFLKRLVNLTDT